MVQKVKLLNDLQIIYLFAPNQLGKFNNETSHEFTLICGAPQIWN